MLLFLPLLFLPLITGASLDQFILNNRRVYPTQSLPPIITDCDLPKRIHDANQAMLQLTVNYLNMINKVDQKFNLGLGLISLPTNVNIYSECEHISTLNDIETLGKFLNEKTTEFSDKLLAH